MTDDEKYERYREFANRCGFRPETKEHYTDHSGHVWYIGIHPLIRDCESMMFIIENELFVIIPNNDVRGFDVFIKPYEGYHDDIVQKAIDMDAKILSLEGFIERWGDFEMEDNKGKKTSIAMYIDKMDYGDFALYDKNAIYVFIDDFFFLSNFYLCDITFDGIDYKNSEAAFQAQKCEDTKTKLEFSQLTPGAAKKLGKKVKLREDWEDVKVDIMRKVVKAKFDQNPEIREKLIATGDRCLIECNVWHDMFWGVSSGKGRNMLGRILMDLRKEYKEAEHGSD